MSQIEAIQKCREVLNHYADDPADEMIQMGKVLIEIGKALKGKSIAESRAIMLAVEQVTIATRTE